MKKKRLSHLDEKGHAKMVDIGAKPDQIRFARAEALFHCNAATIRALKKQALPKGDVLTVAQLAGIQAAKETSRLIPLCHNIPLSGVNVSFQIKTASIKILGEARTTGKTGVEMEALTAVSVAALTLYDMCKAIDKEMSIDEIRLLKKTKT